MRMNIMMLYYKNCISGHLVSHRDAHEQYVRDQKPEGGGEDADPAKDVAKERDDQEEGWVLF